MGHKQRLYLYGMGWACLLIILGELIWIPDPIRIGQHWFWIDLIDIIAYSFLLVPLLWIVAAIWGIAGDYKLYCSERFSSSANTLLSTSLVTLLRTAIIAASGLAFIYILAEDLVPLAIFLGSAWILTFGDMAISEWQQDRKAPWRSLLYTALSLSFLTALLWPMPYMVTYPGLTLNMNRYASVEGGVPHGEIMGVLVFERPAVPIDWLYAELFPLYSFDRIKKNDLSLEELDHLVRAMKLDANALGSAAAFLKLGIGKGVTSLGIKVMDIMADSSVNGHLEIGDVIVAFNGNKVMSVEDLAAQMAKIEPGDTVSLTVVRNAKQTAIDVKTKQNPKEPTKAAFGIQIEEVLKPDLPKRVGFHHYLAHEGGPSHGAMLALVLIDQLTPGGITYGNRVAGTGTINASGIIGKIGGIEQKAYTVNRTEADVFFVPEGQEEEARKGSSELLIVPVKTLQDILEWLQAHPKNNQAE